MIFDLYFNVSKTTVEIAALCLAAGVAVYIANDLIERNEKKSESEEFTVK